MRTLLVRVRVSSMVFHVLAACWCSATQAQALIHFDLPAQSLAQSLKAIGTATNIDVGFSAVQVAGLKAPRVKADLTADEALMRVLAGTGLRPRHLDDHTIVIAAMDPSPGAAEAKPAPESAPASSGQSSNSLQLTKLAGDSTDLRLVRVRADRTVSDAPGGSGAGESKSDGAELAEVVVTGTHIRGVAPSSPVTTITREDIDRSGYTSVGDVIRSLPQNFNGGNNPQLTVGSAPGADNGGTVSGGSSPNLRGLGSGSTLTLVNGHRLADDTINGAVDISLIPLAAIERVEVVTDGASAAYGSDAVAGVVNFILRKNYDGALTSVLGGGTAQGGGTEKQINQLFGKTWASGGILFDYEFDKLDPIYSTQRDYTLLAGSPTTLYPGSSRNSFFLSGHQDFSNELSGFIDALYTSRITTNDVTYPAGIFSLSSETGVKQYSVASGLDVVLPGNWKLTPVVDLTEQRTNEISAVTPPSPYPEFIYEGRTSSFEAGADGPLLQLPSGIVHAAIGGGYRREDFAVIQQGIPSIVNAERGVDYAYTEIEIPLAPPSDRAWLRKLDLNISGREEHYSDFGSEAVPKIGLLYSPAAPINFRTTWGKSFRAPPLYSMYGVNTLLLLPIPDPASHTGSSTVLIPGGGNPQLRPETAKTWTAGFDYDSELIKGLHVAGTYYDIAYINRIGQIPTFYSALTDPLNAPFVTRSPSPAYQQSLINAAGPYFTNGTGAPYDPAEVAAVVNDRMVNIARQDITGVDLAIDYKRPIPHGSLDVFANAAYLDLRQQTVPSAPEVEISGEAFEPAKIRARTGTSWNIGPWATTGIINFVGGGVNTYQPSLPHVSSWTTLDLQLSYRPTLLGPLAGIQAALSVQNVFDRDPPFVLFDQYVPGLHYDPLNASVLGRFISLRLSKEFR